jgi:hypothetical protein
MLVLGMLVCVFCILNLIFGKVCVKIFIFIFFKPYFFENFEGNIFGKRWFLTRNERYNGTWALEERLVDVLSSHSKGMLLYNTLNKHLFIQVLLLKLGLHFMVFQRKLIFCLKKVILFFSLRINIKIYLLNVVDLI